MKNDINSLVFEFMDALARKELDKAKKAGRIFFDIRVEPPMSDKPEKSEGR